MKITAFDFLHLQQHIANNLPINYKDIREAYRTRGLSDMRFRWDLMKYSGVILGSETKKSRTGHNLYNYLKDSHIDTALRKIVAKLDRLKGVE